MHNLSTDALKIMLSNTAPLASNTVKANIAEIAAGNGYVAGGGIAAFVSGADTAGVYKLILSPVLFNAVGGSIGPFEFAVLYNSTTPSGNLIAWWDMGVPLTVINGASFIALLDQSNGVFTLS